MMLSDFGFVICPLFFLGGGGGGGGFVNLSCRGFVSAGVGEDGCDGHGSCPVKDFFFFFI
jgi:hypothetical protein